MRFVDSSQEIILLPYSAVVGQDDLKLALELAYLEPKIEGVLISGHRGSGKSTAVRAFANMMYGGLPVTLPINATEDRVVGGWRIKALMRAKAVREPGLLEEANGKILYIDEVNLLDDHIVNLILDVASTGILVIQREAQSEEKAISFTLVGTMNPEEGGLRPQLLDRFGLMVDVTTQTAPEARTQILSMVLEFDRSKRLLRSDQPAPFLSQHIAKDAERKEAIETAKRRLDTVLFSEEMVRTCVAIAGAFVPQGHRSDYVMALAARGYAALLGDSEVCAHHVLRVAPLALQHRIGGTTTEGSSGWSDDHTAKLRQVLALPMSSEGTAQ
ncbi:MAG: AAA family ATPase [Caldilineaceae bacterium]